MTCRPSYGAFTQAVVEITLADADLREFHFSGAVLREADLSRTWLEKADFSGAEHSILEDTLR
jgi:uncharacterized protein YjbI with pentapeptide repeats